MESGLSFTGADQRPSTGGWAFPALLAVLLLGALWFLRTRPQVEQPSADRSTPAEWAPSPRPQGETVALEIDFGNGASKQFAALPWREGLTVADLLQAAAEFRPGIAFTQKGEGETGFLTALDGLKNGGAGGRNWRYEVNGQHGQASFCLQQLEPSDRVLWKFAGEE